MQRYTSKAFENNHLLSHQTQEKKTHLIFVFFFLHQKPNIENSSQVKTNPLYLFVYWFLNGFQ